MNRPKILLWDIETSPIIAHVWSLWDNNVGLNQIVQDWNIISWAAKWYGHDDVMYYDQRDAANIHDDKELLRPLWHLLNEADVSVTQNGVSFDEKKTNARFIINGFPPPSPYKSVDTKIMAKKKFAFTSNRQDYLSRALGGIVKDKHKSFPGHDLWMECLKNNPAAWDEMRHYNITDVLGLEENYKRMAPWDKAVNYASMQDNDACSACGSHEQQKRGFSYTTGGKFQRYQCLKCGAWSRGKDNLLSKEKTAQTKVRL